jgi:hypothetical protein
MIDPAENGDESPILGGDMSQSGDDMVLRLLSATSHCLEGCAAAPSNSVLTTCASQKAEGHKGHEARPSYSQQGC